jgi:hypothetical protein
MLSLLLTLVICLLAKLLWSLKMILEWQLEYLQAGTFLYLRVLSCCKSLIRTMIVSQIFNFFFHL